MTPWTVALQAPLSVGFSKQEYWQQGNVAVSFSRGPGERLPFPSLSKHLHSQLQSFLCKIMIATILLLFSRGKSNHSSYSLSQNDHFSLLIYEFFVNMLQIFFLMYSLILFTGIVLVFTIQKLLHIDLKHSFTIMEISMHAVHHLTFSVSLIYFFSCSNLFNYGSNMIS